MTANAHLTYGYSSHSAVWPERERERGQQIADKDVVQASQKNSRISTVVCTQ